MHFRSLLTVYIPDVQQEPEWENDISEKIKIAEDLPGSKIAHNVMRKILIEEMCNVSTAFGRELNPVIRDTMERFNCGTEDKRFLEFEDHTEEYLRDYNDITTCIKLPDGRIVEEYSKPLWDKFIVKDGRVYQKYAGPLHHPKRTKKAKKMKALLDYPRRKLYKSFEDYVDQECYGSFNEETGKYGEWYNPDGVFDWYSIGGRWPDMFLVKTDCTEYSFGERGLFTKDSYPAPDGYMWVACARKKDIQWDVMRRWRTDRATERFHQLEAMFHSGEKDETVHAITEEGIMAWGEIVYHKGQTLEDYLNIYGIPASWKYPISVHDIFQDDHVLSKSGYDEFDSETKKWKTTDAWRRTIDEFIDDADDDDIFIGIDYHI